jgi:peptide/nickel transport system permease protein
VIRYALTRILLLALGLIASSVLIFAALRVLPGDVAQMIAGSDGTAEQVAAIRRDLGLDRSLVAQYADWMGGVFTGDLGASLVTGSPVADQLAQKARVTIPLGILSLLIALAISAASAPQEPR